MEYQFRNIVGQSGSITLLQRSVMRKNLGKITILEGLHGTGKTTAALTAALAFNCEESENGEPCLHCSNCRSILDAIEHGGSTRNFVKVNMPEFNTGMKFEDLMKEIFVLQNSQQVVYVLEEAHALKDKNLQTALLEQIDKMPQNVHLIMTTTELGDLIQPLRSRARIYHFTRLSTRDSELLLSIECKNRDISLDQETSRVVVNAARGIPRDLISLLDFISQNSVTMDELLAYLCVIDTYSFIDLFTAMTEQSITSMMQMLDSISAKASLRIFIQQLKEFYLNVIFLIEGGISDYFTGEQADAVKSLVKPDALFKIAAIIEKFSYNSSEADVKFAFLRMHQLMIGSSLESSLVKPSATISTQVQQRKEVIRDNAFIKQKAGSSVKELTRSDFLETLDVFGKTK